MCPWDLVCNRDALDPAGFIVLCACFLKDLTLHKKMPAGVARRHPAAPLVIYSAGNREPLKFWFSSWVCIFFRDRILSVADCYDCNSTMMGVVVVVVVVAIFNMG